MRSRIHYSWVLLFVAAGLAAGAATALQACGVNGEIIYPCEDPIIGRRDHNGRPDPCCQVDPCHDEDAGADADADGTESSDEGDGGPPCSGACVAIPLYDWQGPGPVWFGPPGAEPDCPANAPAAGFDGFEGVDAEPATCACFCTTPGGACGLTTTFTASSAACGSGGALTPFDGPSGWDGSCTSFDTIPAGALCNGAPCVRSLTAGPLALLSEQPCAPVSPEPLIEIPPAKVKAAVRACRGATPFCNEPGQLCSPTAPGFETCIYQQGDNACPAPYSEKHLVAKGVEDDRACTACSCGPPSGGFCTATLTVFKDNACGAELLSIPIASSGPSCFDIMPSGLPLGSKSITDLHYVPGACAATGGASVGGVTPTGTATFCCLP